MPKRAHTLNLTKRVIDALTPDSDDAYYWDDALPGFGVRIRDRIHTTYILRYRTSTGTQRKRTLGTHGVLTPVQARKLAMQWLADLQQGRDPATARDSQRNAPTVEQLGERYMRDHARLYKKPHSIRADDHNLRLHILPHLGRLYVTAVARADILKFHRAMQHIPIAANRCVSLLSKMFNLAEDWGWCEPRMNPVWRIPRYPEQKKERYLTPDEFQRLGEVLQDAEQTKTVAPEVLAAIRLLIFTGCRRDEILKLRWDEVDLARRCLHLGDSKTGAKVVQLGAEACAILEHLPRTSAYVIPGKDPTKPRYTIERPWHRIRQRAGIPDVRLHDLRHSFASFGVSLGMSLPLVGALLGHADAATTQRYAHLHNDPVREAVEHINTAIAAAMGGTPS